MKERRFEWLLGLWVLTVLLAALAIGKYLELRRVHQELRAEVDRRAEAHLAVAQETERLRPGPTGFSQEERLELMRLRNEVTQLRATAAAAREALKVASQNQAAERAQRAEIPMAEATGQEGALAREQWAFRGYATPEDALVSTLWALASGNTEIVPGTMTPSERETWEQQTSGKNDAEIEELVQRQLRGITSVQVTEQRQNSPTEVVLTVQMESQQGSRTRDVHTYLVGHEWKAQMFEFYDPLAFYRRNPELMKRYFPHLYNPNAAPPQNPGGTLPPEPSPNQ